MLCDTQLCDHLLCLTQHVFNSSITLTTFNLYYESGSENQRWNTFNLCFLAMPTALGLILNPLLGQVNSMCCFRSMLLQKIEQLFNLSLSYCMSVSNSLNEGYRDRNADTPCIRLCPTVKQVKLSLHEKQLHGKPLKCGIIWMSSLIYSLAMIHKDLCIDLTEEILQYRMEKLSCIQYHARSHLCYTSNFYNI